jgi:hypothetical protein
MGPQGVGGERDSRAGHSPGGTRFEGAAGGHMKNALIIANERAEHQKSWGGAFARGLEKHGWSVGFDTMHNRRAYDLLVVWGTRRAPDIARQKAAGGEVCVLERGYLGNRFEWTSVSFGGGLNGRGVFRGPVNDPSRWNEHFAGLMKPWKDDPKGYALLLQQVPGDMSLRGTDIDSFYEKAKATFKPLMRVKVRVHPNLKPSAGEAFQAARLSLQDDLAGAAFAITWNSNAAVDAVLAGVPAIAMDRGSMAWDVTGHELKAPPAPDRAGWASAIAWKQWRKEELESGYCWENVRG